MGMIIYFFFGETLTRKIMYGLTALSIELPTYPKHIHHLFVKS